MKKLASLFLLLTFLVMIGTQTAMAEVVVYDNYIQTFSQPDETYGESVIMMELVTGTVVYEKEIDMEVNPGALVKIMTALLVMEYVGVDNLDQEIVCYEDIINDSYWDENWVQTSGLLANDIVSIGDLLKSMLVQSDCDSAVILARYVGETYLDGDEETFVEQMNLRAEELGCTNTNFVNVHGLSEDGQVSTASDLMIIASTAVAIDEFTDYSSYNYFQIAASEVRSYSLSFYAENQMSSSISDYYYSMAINIRMGRTTDNQQHLITMVRGGVSDYLVITLNTTYLGDDGYRTNEAYMDAISLFDWAYDNFTISTVVAKQDVSCGAEVTVNLSLEKNYTLAVAEEAVTLLVPKTLDDSDIMRVAVLSYTVDAPVETGQVLGKLQIQIDDLILATVPLIATEDISQSRMLTVFSAIKSWVNSPIVHQVIIMLLVLLVAMILITVRYNQVRRKKLELKKRREEQSNS